MHMNEAWLHIKPGTFAFTLDGEIVKVLGYETRISGNVHQPGYKVITVGMDAPEWRAIHTVVDEITLIHEVKDRTNKAEKLAEAFLRSHDEEMRKINDILSRLRDQDAIMDEIDAMGFEADGWRLVEGESN